MFQMLRTCLQQCCGTFLNPTNCLFVRNSSLCFPTVTPELSPCFSRAIFQEFFTFKIPFLFSLYVLEIMASSHPITFPMYVVQSKHIHFHTTSQYPSYIANIGGNQNPNLTLYRKYCCCQYEAVSYQLKHNTSVGCGA